MIEKDFICFNADELSALETAKNAGLDCIAVLWGFRDEDYLVEQGAKVFAKNPEDIERLVIG